jgi:cell shape-determining protein MreC
MNSIPKEIMDLLHQVIQERDELKKELEELKKRLVKILEDENNELL